MSQRTVYRACNLCEATCGIAVDVEGRSVVKVRGDADDPFSRGHVCPKAIGLKELQDDPDRLRRPVLRTADGWREIGWDEAIERAAAGLARVREAGGPDAVALYRGNPTVHDYATTLGVNVLSRALGTRNAYSAGALDTWPKFVQTSSMYGGPLRCPVPDVDRTDYLLIVGANPIVSNGSLWTVPDVKKRLAAVRARGGRIVVVDPRRSETAERADEHHFIRPGSDAAFLLAMIHTLFAEDRVDLDRLGDLVNDLDAVREAVAPYTPERVEGRCGIDAATIRRLARELSEAERAVAYGRMGTCVQQFGTLSCWALDLLCILTGNLDREGGAMFGNPATPLHFALEPAGGVEFGRWRSRVGGRDEILGEFPVMALAEEIETPGEGQIRALLIAAGNPARTAPNSARIERALASLEFMVALDYYVNETTRHADLILPPLGPLEREHYDVALSHFAVRTTAKWSPAAVEPEPGARDTWEVALDLGRRLMGLEGLGLAEFDGLVLRQFAEQALARSAWRGEIALDEVIEGVGGEPGPRRILDALLRLGPHGDAFGRIPGGLTLARVVAAEHGLDLGALEPRLPGHLATKSGRIELAPARVVGDLPRLAAWLEEPDDGALRLINRRDLKSMNSWLHNLPTLARGRERCTLQIHPDDAARRGVRNGEPVRVFSGTGELIALAEVTTAVGPGTASLPHGFGHETGRGALRVAHLRPGANVNAVTSDRPVDAPSGASVLFGASVACEALPRADRPAPEGPRVTP